MRQQRSFLILLLLVAVTIGVILGLYTANYRFSERNPGGNDFLVHWVGTRAFIIDGLSPYTDAVALRIQNRAYGRPAGPGEHELRVAYPLYSTIIFAPFALVSDYVAARAAWMTLLEVALLVLSVVCLRITNWKPGTLSLFIFFLFSFVWYHGARPLINGNAVILVALLIALALLAIKNGRDEVAGALLALATIKPQVVVLFYLLVALWALSHRRWALVGWMVGGVIFLSALMMLFIPEWLLQNLREVLRYPAYNPPGTPGAAFEIWMPAIGGRLGWALALILAVILLLEWAAAWGKDFRWFMWTAGFTLAASGWSGIQTDPGNFIAMFPALVLIFAVWEERWGINGRYLGLMSMALLAIGLWWLFLSTVEMGPQPQQHPIMIFPLPLFLITGSYWVRWSAIRPHKLWLEEIRERELA